MAVREGLFLRELCHDLGLKIQTPTPLLLDNKSVRSIWRSIQWLSRKPNTFYETRTSCATKSPSLWLDLPMFAPRISWRTFSRSLVWFGLVCLGTWVPPPRPRRPYCTPDFCYNRAACALCWPVRLDSIVSKTMHIMSFLLLRTPCATPPPRADALPPSFCTPRAFLPRACSLRHILVHAPCTGPLAGCAHQVRPGGPQPHRVCEAEGLTDPGMYKLAGIQSAWDLR